MCGRYVLATPVAELAAYFSAQVSPALVEHFHPSWNIPPSSNIIAITADASGTRHMDRYRWGLVPSWANDLSFGARTTNARAETVATKPSFRSAFRSRRCIVPADGYFEWKTTVGEVKQPYYFFRHDNAPLGFAGLWERFDLHHAPQGEPRSILTCTIITTAASLDVEAIHSRMPLILEDAEAWERWLDNDLSDREELLSMCRPPREGMLSQRRVSKAVNRVGNDGPELIDELEERSSLF